MEIKAPTTIEPDLEFIQAIKANGGDTLKNCYQCASCSVVCALSPEDHPFPRKEMLWAQWGLKERLFRDPDIWLCYQCNDCSQQCPRGARPGDVLATVRHLVILDHSFSRFLGLALNRPQYLPMLLAIPAFLLVLLLSWMGTFRIPPGEIIYARFIPYSAIDGIFIATAVWVAVSSGLGIRSLWKKFAEGLNPETPLRKLGIKSIWDVVQEWFAQRRFHECTVHQRFWAHFNIFWGVILLAVTTFCVFIGIYVFGVPTPRPLSHPVKWIGNLGATLLIYGSLKAIWDRMVKKEILGQGFYFDWLFLWTIFAAGFSGLLTEIFRLADFSRVAYPMYFLHLIFVWLLFISLPFSKFTHFLYRSAAFFYYQSTDAARLKNREKT